MGGDERLDLPSATLVSVGIVGYPAALARYPKRANGKHLTRTHVQCARGIGRWPEADVVADLALQRDLISRVTRYGRKVRTFAVHHQAIGHVGSLALICNSSCSGMPSM